MEAGVCAVTEGLVELLPATCTTRLTGRDGVTLLRDEEAVVVCEGVDWMTGARVEEIEDDTGDRCDELELEATDDRELADLVLEARGTAEALGMEDRVTVRLCERDEDAALAATGVERCGAETVRAERFTLERDAEAEARAADAD